MIHVIGLTLALAATPAPPPDTAVVCPAAFRAAFEPWRVHRTAQGHRIELVDNRGTPEEIRERLRRAADGGALRFVVLVGDAAAAGAVAAADDCRVPAHLAPAKVVAVWGSEPEIATDNWYGDLDGDRVPEVAVGRLPVDSPAELTLLVEKILAYEHAAGNDTWRRQINLVAGLGGFGAIADTTLEAAAKSILTAGLPAEYVTTMTYASWRSPYCPEPAAFHQVALDRLNEGCLFWVYLGHGQRRWLDGVKTPEGLFPIFAAADAPKLRARSGAPIALFLACYTGAYDDQQDCLAEEMLRQQGGPVAVISSSRVSMPYAMCVLGVELLKECFVERRPTVGEMLLFAKRNTALSPRADDESRRLDALAALLNPMPGDLAEERAEHLLLFNLLGDPLLRLRQPRAVELEVPPTATAGSPLILAGTSPVAGEALVELVVRRDRLAFRPPGRDEYRSTPEAQEERRQTYARANDGRLAWRRLPVDEGRFQTELDVPPTAWGDCHVRVFVQGRDDFASGAANLTIRRTTTAK